MAANRGQPGHRLPARCPARVRCRRQGSVRDTSTLQITAITVAASANDYDGNPVSAGAGFQYVLLDCHFTVPSNQVDLTDFQLVRERVPETGTETNLGNNDDRDYFYWTYLDQAGQRLTAPPDTTGPFRARLAFKVPADIRAGYLFYWGLYWGPLWFPEGAS
mgnify:CR=1 FL=1